MKKDVSPEAKLFGYLIAWPIFALMFWWYNHVWVHPVLPFWQWLILAIIGLWATHGIKFIMNRLLSFVFFASLTIQLLSWFKVIVLPIIK